MPHIDPTAIICFDQVSYSYPNRDSWAIKDISLRIASGEFLGVVGATGSGKSTLCLSLNGIVPQFYGGRFFGHLRVAGMDTVDTPVNELALRVGMAFEDPEMQLTSVSVEAEVAFALENAGLAPEEMCRRIPAALHKVGLDGLEHRHPSDLSGGQKQRLAIASALALQPDVLVLDEPTSQLDPWAATSLFATLHALNRDLGITVIIASHASELLAEHCDRVVVLDNGGLLAVDTPDQIFSDEVVLSRANIRAPQVAQIFFNLAHKGFDVSPIPVTLDMGVDALRQLADKPMEDIDHKHISQQLTSPPVVQADQISFAYDDDPLALHDVSLIVRAGEYILLAGQNGAGKTTLIKHFLGLLRPQWGTVCVNGEDTKGRSVAEIAQRIGYIAQNPDHQLFCNTVAEEVAFGLEAKRLPRETITARVDTTLALLGLTSQRNVHPLSLPRGERTRVVLAAVLALEPDILIFDEPTVGQDYTGAMSILNLTRDLHQLGKTVVVVTHHLHLIADYAQRAVILYHGKIAFDGLLRDAFYDNEMLKTAHLIPPQAVQLVQAIVGPDASPKLLMPAEIANAIVLGNRAVRE